MTEIMRAVALAVIIAVAFAAAAQDEYAPLPPLPLGDVLLTLPTSHMPDRRTW